ncbi:hypothetical protein D5366_11750 (plasmid) [Neokomagataea tanensis]|uniref:Uncharacterized protein n=1 Tax=Neokomagataea tanensis TaxID=661191 RepID=A0A4Y6VAX5_9PROT|nr:hypothetical protein D5366_11750 [Neokomagataea tanensis]
MRLVPVLWISSIKPGRRALGVQQCRAAAGSPAPRSHAQAPAALSMARRAGDPPVAARGTGWQEVSCQFLFVIF